MLRLAPTSPALEISAFSSCSKLTSVTIPDSVTSIGTNAFYNCYRLTNVIIGNSVTNIGDGVFTGCTSLSTITVNASNSVYSSVDGVLFNQSQTTLVEYPVGLGRKLLHDSKQRHQHWELCVRILHQPDQRHDPQQRHQHRKLCVL